MELTYKQLRAQCDPKIFRFQDTAEITARGEVIGQDRAQRALEFGLKVKQPGYNIYLAGPTGTGKTSLAQLLIEKRAAQETVPDDWCYVHNFDTPNRPLAIDLPAGKGKHLQKDMEHLITTLRQEIPRAFESESFETQKNEALNSFITETNRMYSQAEKKAKELSYTLNRTSQGIGSVPLKDGQPITQEQFDALPEIEKNSILTTGQKVQEIINEGLREYRGLEKSIRHQVSLLEQETARMVLSPLMEELYKTYRPYEKVISYLEKVQADIMNNVDLFTETEEGQTQVAFFKRLDKRTGLKKYRVNLLVDNSQMQHAPVIFENNATYSNIFGSVEYEGEFGILSTDFTKIKGGSIHRANGGYLVLQVRDLLRFFVVYDTLKRVLKTGEAVVESVYKNYGFASNDALEPESIPINIKVILIGDQEIYHALYHYDEDFQKLFKVRCDFSSDMERDRTHLRKYAHFVASICQEKGLLPFSRTAVAAVVDYGTRMADDQGRLSTHFNRLAEIVYEAEVGAREAKQTVVEAEHVKTAIQEKVYRVSLVEERMQDYIRRGTILIDVEGEKVGQLNGLAVYNLGDYAFGLPSRITAKTFMGERGVVNIEREIKMSGNIHSKGVLILSGYLGGKFAQKYPLSLSASFTFEQNYSGIEGDSASSTELYALLSSLAGIPLKQYIAVTGSVNQNGDIQPVGGINEKIEGFFKICQQKGLNGSQGVIIPIQNVVNLMLNDEVVEAVKSKSFHIWAIASIDQGLELLTGLTAGEADERGEYPPGTIYCQVAKKLKEWAQRRERGHKKEIASNRYTKKGSAKK
ncbi:MAG: Lon protease family protein [Methylocystaceae bacterium]